MVWYRLSMKIGYRTRLFPIGVALKGSFFREIAPIDHYPEEWRERTIRRAKATQQGTLRWFHHHDFTVGSPPNWFLNPFTQTALQEVTVHWTQLSDFDLNVGDIKTIWEPSRMDWLTDVARAYRITGDSSYLETINGWLHDWSAKNPLNQGPNWKCGQETAIRVIRLITTAHILGQYASPSDVLQQMVYQHLCRIYPNLGYAMAQDNNHGTSEAAGLYIGAAWLLSLPGSSFDRQQLSRWCQVGRAKLENRILHLIEPQGTFAQKSLNYHRVVVDTLSWVLFHQEQMGDARFSEPIQDRLLNLGTWQWKMIATDAGEVPNFGSNDGAMLETLHNCDYTNYRASTALFFGILLKKRILAPGPHEEVLFWRYPTEYAHFPWLMKDFPTVEILDKQFLIGRSDSLWFGLILPDDRFRPTSNDPFHLDLWFENQNILCDSGTFSYNAGSVTDAYKSVSAHNTVQMGEHEPMPKISKFLYGKWLNTKEVQPLEEKEEKVQWAGLYRDQRGRVHTRKIEWSLTENRLVVTDQVESSQNEKLTLRWHGKPAGRISVTDLEGKILEAQIENNHRSRYYMAQENKMTHEYITHSKGFRTEIIW